MDRKRMERERERERKEEKTEKSEWQQVINSFDGASESESDTSSSSTRIYSLKDISLAQLPYSSEETPKKRKKDEEEKCVCASETLLHTRTFTASTVSLFCLSLFALLTLHFLLGSCNAM